MLVENTFSILGTDGEIGVKGLLGKVRLEMRKLGKDAYSKVKVCV